MRAQDRVVLVTGATRGIGFATAKQLARAGCLLLLSSRDGASLDAAIEEMALDRRRVVGVPADMAVPSQIRALPAAAIAAFGRLDAIINNAGVGIRGPIAQMADEDSRYVMDVNYFGPLALIQAAVPFLAQNPQGGLVVNVASIASRRAGPYTGGYCASKAALERMSEALRLELRGQNIRVSVLYPGATATGFNATARGEPMGAARSVPTVSVERVAAAVLRVVQAEPRDAFVSMFDQAFLFTAAFAPGLVDWLVMALFERRSTP